MDDKRIGLLTPYTGGNLGDGAIQEAVIQSIRKRRPDAFLCGFTLHPKDTEERHHIPSFPITGLRLSYYSMACGDVTHEASGRESERAGFLGALKSKIKTARFIDLMPRTIHECARKVCSLLRFQCSCARMVLSELRHIVRSYKMAKSLDLLIVSGGGQIDEYWGGPLGHPYSLFKWAMISRFTGSRLIFLSVGTCSIDSKWSRFFLRHALKSARYRSYRDSTSKKLLESMPFTRQDPVFPDLAFGYLPEAEGEHPGCEGRKKLVGISPIAYLSSYWPKNDPRAYENYIHQLAAFVSMLIQQEYHIMLFTTASPDVSAVKRLTAELQNEDLSDFEEKVFAPPIGTVDALFWQLRSVDCVVASRLHGVLLSHLIKKPVLAISYDRKVDTYMDEMNQSDYCIDIHQCDFDSLDEKFKIMESNETKIRSVLVSKVNDNRRCLELQYDMIFNSHI
jgi:polysaccharide pyruvyl transferase WcaK-like protein